MTFPSSSARESDGTNEGSRSSSPQRRERRHTEEMEDMRAAMHASSVRSDSGHTRQQSSGSTSSTHSSSSHSGPWKEAFIQLRDELGPTPSPDAMGGALRKFLDNLPPFYASAAIDFVKDMALRKQTVNLDGLADYFTKLDQSSAEAQRLPVSTPPPHAYSPTLKRSPASFKTASLSPSSTSPRSRMDGDHFADFAPSRPHVSNLLLSDGERSPPPPVVSCPPP